MLSDDNVLQTNASEIDLRLIGPVLRALRKEQGLLQTEVAERAGITKAMLSSYETGKCLPVLSSLTAVLKVLRCDLRRLQDTMDRLALVAGVEIEPMQWWPSVEHELGRAVLLLVHRLTSPQREPEDPPEDPVVETVPETVPSL
jgi:transcriptional regulator with XRE-family HTH domain